VVCIFFPAAASKPFSSLTESSLFSSSIFPAKALSVIGGAIMPREGEHTATVLLGDYKVEDDDEILFVTKEDGRREPLDGSKVGSNI
jgi:hypothetical protein